MIQFDPSSPHFRQNPYPYYDELRAQAPVYFWAERNLWLLSRWEDCNHLLRDHRLGNDPVGKSMLFQNPPDHTRLRSLVQKAFTPRRVEQLRSQVQQLTNARLDQIQAKNQWDVVADLAYPLPVVVIATMLGVPAADHGKFHTWSNALVDSLDLVRDPALEDRLATAGAGFRDYFEHLIRIRRANPQDDLLSALIAAEEVGDRLSSDELYFNARLLLVAGYETTVGLIGNGFLALLRNPDQQQLLQQQPDLIANAVEELLRYDSPIQMVTRVVLEPMSWQGFTFETGQGVGFLTGAANRDPAHADRPNQLDITRTSVQHLAFGSGIHYCLGAPLARLEGQIAIRTVLQRFPRLTLAEAAPPLRNNFIFRSLQRLHVVDD